MRRTFPVLLALAACSRPPAPPAPPPGPAPVVAPDAPAVDVTLITFLDDESFREALIDRKGPLHYEGRDDEWLYVSAPPDGGRATVFRIGCDVMNDGELLSFGRERGRFVAEPRELLSGWRRRAGLGHARDLDLAHGPRFHFIAFDNSTDLLATLHHADLRPTYLGCDEDRLYISLRGIREFTYATHALLSIERDAIDPQVLRALVQEMTERYDAAFAREWLADSQPPWGTYAPAFRRWQKRHRLDPRWPVSTSTQ